MSRDGLSHLGCAVLVFVFALPGQAAPPDDRDAKFANMLAVQRALQEGREQLQRGNYQLAVSVLENQVARIDGNREYLNVLRDAYRGHIRELQQNNRGDEVAVYLRRLEILEPVTGLDKAPVRPPATAADPATKPAEEKTAQTPKPLALLAQTATGTKGATVRGVREEDKREPADSADPFHASNGKNHSEVRALLDRAELEFSGRRYDAAGKLFEQVHHLDPTAAAAARERWAYCKIFAVVDLLNRSAVSDQNSRQVEQEVRQAMSMSPKLDGFGKDLLKKIQERSGATVAATTNESTAVEVRHTPARGQGWAIADTANFRIFHRLTPDAAERVARIAETTRTNMTRKWFSDDVGVWNPRCDLFLHATGQDYAKATGVPATSPGHSTIRREGDRVLSRRIDLHNDDPNMTIGVLPHETTHVVLAGRFGDYDVPRWADEGMAVLSEPRDRIERHLRNLPKHSQERQLFGVGQLMRLNDYPDPRYIGPFYAQSVSLVEFLSREKGPRVFAQFLRDGLKGGYEPALERYYGCQGFHNVEARWQRAALAEPNGTPAVAERNP